IPLIRNYTVIGGGQAFSFGDSQIEYSWSDGGPSVSASRTTTGVVTFGSGNGFHLSVPADTAARTVTLYVGAFRGRGSLTATLSDSSAAPFTDTSVDTTTFGVSDQTYVISYRAGSAGQT